ncbi:unnamed protein product, partial [Mesorhabditis spiculigera]
MVGNGYPAEDSSLMNPKAYFYNRPSFRWVGENLYRSMPQIQNDPHKITRYTLISIILNFPICIGLILCTKNTNDRCLYTLVYLLANIGDFFAFHGVKTGNIKKFFTSFGIISCVLGIKIFIALILLCNHIVSYYFTNIGIPILVLVVANFDLYRLFLIQRHIIHKFEVATFTQKFASMPCDDLPIVVAVRDEASKSGMSPPPYGL